MEKDSEILLVEDNMNDAELIMRALKKNNIGNRVVHLRDGADALDYIFCEGHFSGRKFGTPPRVILLDLKMPKVDGIGVLTRIKKDERTRTIPVVVLTSSSEDPDIKKCYELNVNSYVVKPVQFEKFVKAVADVGLYWMIINQPPK
jgi:two-component system response regulator